MGCFVDKEQLKSVYEEALKKAGIVVLDVAFPIIIRSGINELGETLHYLFTLRSGRDRNDLPV